MNSSSKSIVVYGEALTLARANAFAGAMCGVRGAVPADLAFYRTWIGAWLADAEPAQAAA